MTGADLGLQLTQANLADDVDVIEIHQDFYGVRWDAFEKTVAPPAEWTAKMTALAAAAKSTRVENGASIPRRRAARPRRRPSGGASEEPPSSATTAPSLAALSLAASPPSKSPASSPLHPPALAATHITRRTLPGPELHRVFA